MTELNTVSRDAGFCTARNRRFVLLAAILASALGFIDGSLVAIALPAMRADLGASLIAAQWINNAYLLPLSAIILIGGALGDRFGTARCFAWGIGIFVVASVMCALAPSAEALIAARALKGVGAAVMIPGSLALIAKAYPKEERGRAIGIWAAASALTTALGPIFAGVALEYGGSAVWRWLFGINLPFGAIAIWLVTTKVARDPRQSARQIDLVGGSLITIALAVLASSLTGGLSIWGLVLGAALLGLFLVWEARTPDPMVPLALFKDPTFAAANAATALIYFALSTVLFFLPMTMIAGWGMAEISASAAFAPLSLFIATLSARAGSMADQRGPGRMIGLGGALAALAFSVLALTAPLQSFWLSVLPGTTLMGLGMALVVSPLSTAIMGAVPEDSTGAASGINNAVSRVAGLLAVAIMGSIAGQIYVDAGGAASFGAPSTLDGHGDAMTTAFVRLAWITSSLTAVGAALAWWMIPPPHASITSARR